MTPGSQTRSYFRTAAIFAGLLLPAVTLIPFGSLWLWQHGYILHWAITTGCLVGLATLVQWRLLRPTVPATGVGATFEPVQADDLADPSWSPAEAQAWADVVGVAERVDVTRLTTRESVLELGAETVRVVALRLHPEVADPLWQFTVPEALALLERVSRRLGKFAADSIPLSDRLTVARALSLYRWRGAIDIAEKAYDVWRLVRLANPLTAATQEMRERFTRQMLQWGRAHVTQRLAHAYVTEVGRAAIDLYGGRLRESAQQSPTAVSGESRADDVEVAGRTVEPLRILVAGQTGVGKSSLVNALANEVHAAVDALPATAGFIPYELRKAGFPTALLIDTPGLGSSGHPSEALISKATSCDLVLWVVAANRADREIDRLAIVALRDKFAAMPNRRTPPVVLILSHIDRLRPFQEWLPPYDLGSGERPKAASIRAAMDAAALDLKFEIDDVVPVNLSAGAPYNIDALWARMLMVLPDTQRAQLVRRLQDARSDWSWHQVWSQATTGGRVLARTLRP